jgi:hypothetical protein
MNKIILLLVGIFLTVSAQAQKAEPIQSFAKEAMPMQWYKQQLSLWKKEVEKNKLDENAWYNVFRAQRILSYHDSTDHRKTEERDADLIKVVDEMEKVISNTYTFNFCKWQLGGNDMKYYPYLEKAIAIAPNRKDHIDYMINIGELQRNSKQRNEYSLKRINVGEMSTGMMYYNYNTLIGLEKNAILITAGDNDTYPAWALQAQGIRTDVTVLNAYLLHIKEYREKVFTELGIKQIDISKEDEFEFFNKKLVKHLAQNKNNYPVYLALTSAGCNNLLDEIEDKLYLIGLAYVYQTNSIDNIAILKKNVEQLYALDYLDKAFYTEISIDRTKQINQNYIVPMLKLYEHYKMAGDIQKLQWIKEKLIFISKGADDEKTILKYLD